MKSEILVSAEGLHELTQAGQCVVVDCRFDFSDKNKGRVDWQSAHIPGSFYAHLDDDLAAPVHDSSGRHPLPQASVFAEFLASIGWSPGKLLVAYDNGSSAISVRLWWLMHYFNQSAAVLDGGLAAWMSAGYALESGATSLPSVPATKLTASEHLTVSSEQVQANIETGKLTVLDARAVERFAGLVEPLDTKGGHIPGALNRPFQLNLSETGAFKKPEALYSEFSSILGELTPTSIAHSCGSGVTACHNLFAMELAGMSPSLLYPGSWSEWIRDPDRPIATGN